MTFSFNATSLYARVAFASVLVMTAAETASGQEVAGTTAHVRDSYDRHNAAAVTARKAGDWGAVRRHAIAVDSLFNGNPATLIAIARASARLGDTAAALEAVRTVVSMGVTRNLAADEDLVALRPHREWNDLLSANESNSNSMGEVRVRFAIPTVDFLAEDIVPDARRGRYLVSSVRKGLIVAVDAAGKTKPFADARNAGAWGILALGVDTIRSRLWATTVAMPHVEGYSAVDSGKSAVLRFDLVTGQLQKRYDLRATRRGNSPGDVAVAPNGDLFVSDSRSGIVYVLEVTADSLSVLIPEGTFMSPQGPALSPDGKWLYVADYVRGIAQVDLKTREVRWLRHARDAALSGIDGLTMVGRDHLIAIQNGIAPNRVISITVDPETGAATRVRILAQDKSVIREPTHGFVVGSEFFFIANSGWDGFDDRGALRANHGLVPPVVAGVRLNF
jgi:sugar lactone lactonase YvrE